MLRLSRILLTIVAALALSGCGDGEKDFVFTSTGGDVAQAPSVLAGKLFLGAPVAGVPITVESLQGEVLATSTTNASGSFLFRRIFPDSFRVAASFENGLTFYREFRDFNSNPGFAGITIPSTLVSLHSRANPGVDLSLSEATVRRALSLPADYYLSSLNESASSPFSHLAFFVRARTQGGLAAYLASFAQTVETRREAFSLRTVHLDQNYSDLDARIAQAVDRFRVTPRVRLGTERTLSRGLSTSLTSASPEGIFPSQVRAQVGEVVVSADVVLSVLGFVGKNVGAAVIKDLTSSGYTWIASLLSGHSETDDMAQIIDTLNDISQQVDLILKGVAFEFAQPLLAAQADIQNLQSALTIAFNTAAATTDYFNDQPQNSTVPENITKYLNPIRNASALNDIQNDVETIQLYLTGNTSVPQATTAISYPPVVVNPSGTVNYVTQQRDAVLDAYGISKGSDIRGDMPVRSAYLLDQALASFEGYAQTQILGAHLAGEAAHQTASPGISFNQGKAVADNVARSLLSTRAQLPAYPPDDNYFLDLDNGLLWYMVSEGAAYDASTGQSGTAEANQAFAQAFSPDGSRGWRLPFWDEIRSLQDRGGAAATGGSGISVSQTQAGLEALGFDFRGALSVGGRTTNPPICVADWRYDNGVFGSHTWAIEPSGLYWVPSSTSTNELPDSQTGFLMVRSISANPCYDINPPTISGGREDGTWPAVMAGTFYANEAAFVGVPTTLSATVTTQAGNSGTIEVDSSYVAYMGGSFNVAGSDRSTDYTRNPSLTTRNPFVYFLTNDNQTTTVSNYKDSSSGSSYGQLIAHVVQGGSLQTTISYFGLGYVNGSFPATMAGAATNTWSSQPTISLQNIQISPYNSVLNLLDDPTQAPSFVATGFYSDGTARDISDLVSWTATYIANDGTEQPAPGLTFSIQNPNQLIPNLNETIPQNVIIRVSINETANNITNNGSAQTKLMVITR